jgi:diguanylate cyclase
VHTDEQQQRSRRWSTWSLNAAVLALGLFATGTVARPAGPVWAAIYDLGLYNVVYLCAAAACILAVRRSDGDRLAWAAMAVSAVLGITANLLYSLVVATMDPEPFPSVADAFYLLYYAPLYVALIILIRARAPRFHASMWLDGAVGALGAGAVAFAVLLRPALELTDGDTAAVVTNLAYPVADVVLLALLVAVGAILGMRGDRTLVLVGAAIGATLVGDIVYLDLTITGGYVEGGVLDLTWLTAMVLTTMAAHTSRSRPALGVRPEPKARVGWRVLAVPLTCNVASLVVLAAGYDSELSPAAAWLAVGCVLTAFVRTALTFREVRSYNEIREQARTDELTGLPNRRALLSAAHRIVAEATAQQPAAFLLLDLDGFKEVNDSLGHHAGDELLRQVGPRLTPALGPGDLLARLGGDEFAVLMPGAGLDLAQARAEQLRDLLLQPFTVEGIRLHVGVSIGVATAPVPAVDVTELLRCADVAMYTAKSSRSGVTVYVPDPDGGTGDRLRTMEELRTALDEDQLVVHVQPQVRLADGRVVGAEALVRWEHPTRGLLSPAQLLPAAEQAGLLRPLTDRVLDLALDAAAGWWDAHAVPVSVNLSAANVTDLDLPWKVEAALERRGLPPQVLTLELVEDTLMIDPDRGRTVLGELRRIGIRTSIDDYGTGYSSLAYLRHLPADELKLDRSLTQDVHADPRAAAIVRHTVALAHDLGLDLVAEGVEDVETAGVLAQLGCDVVQGYLLARPMPVDDFRTWLELPAPRTAGVPG